jgi:hypothetical protein
MTLVKSLQSTLFYSILELYERQVSSLILVRKSSNKRQHKQVSRKMSQIYIFKALQTIDYSSLSQNKIAAGTLLYLVVGLFKIDHPATVRDGTLHADIYLEKNKKG